MIALSSQNKRSEAAVDVMVIWQQIGTVKGAQAPLIAASMAGTSAGLGN